MVELDTYSKINEEIKFTEDETVELLKLSEKEILVLILSELKKYQNIRIIRIAVTSNLFLVYLVILDENTVLSKLHVVILDE